MPTGLTMSSKKAWDDFFDRVQKLSESGEKHVDIAKRLGVARSYVTKILSGTLTGEKTNATKMIGYLRAVGLDPSDYFETSVKSEDFDFVPHVCAKLGAGHSLETDGRVDGMMAFRKAFLSRFAPASRLVLFDVRGDSMEPTVLHGDTVLINTAETDIRSGELYAIRVGDELSIKRLERLPGKVLVRSDNPQHHSFELNLEEIDGDFAVIGRVRWIGRVL